MFMKYRIALGLRRDYFSKDTKLQSEVNIWGRAIAGREICGVGSIWAVAN